MSFVRKSRFQFSTKNFLSKLRLKLDDEKLIYVRIVCLETSLVLKNLSVYVIEVAKLKTPSLR